MNRKNNRANRAPLRKIVNWYNLSGRVMEVLECGHIQAARQDHAGSTNAYRRRCSKCERGLPVEAP